MTIAEVPIRIEEEPSFSNSPTNKELSQTELLSSGVVMNSLYELEPTYADHYTKVLGRRSWAVGPVSLCNTTMEDKTDRGNRTMSGSVTTHHDCLKWLDDKEPGSVVYVCFGSFVCFNAHQLQEIALGLEASEQRFVWVVREDERVQGEEWLPQGYERRLKEQGLLIRGWAPQVLILDHQAVGSFVMHCGWNSTMEAIAAGVSMVTWPMGADQYSNEKLVTQVLKIGIPVGRKYGGRRSITAEDDQVIKSEMVEKAVKRVMVGEEAAEMRRKAAALSEMAKKAVEEGGSSHMAMTSLLEELKSQRGASKANV